MSPTPGWTTFGGTTATNTFLANPNDFYNTPNSPGISIDLSSIAGANNNPKFGVRLVSAYDSTGNVANEYAAATLVGGQTVAYNGTSGNWRFDNMTFSGSAIPAPEPSTVALISLAAPGLLRRRKRI